MKIKKQLLPYNDLLEKRDTKDLRLIVLHCTELPSLEMAREYGERVLYQDGTGNSGHYYIDRDGSIYQYVEDDRVARHVIGFNKNSIGLEMVNSGRYPDWFDSRNQQPVEPYTDEQIEAVKALCRYLKQKYPTLMEIARHEDLDTQMIPAKNDPDVMIRRKIDPGPLFPWDEILSFWRKL